MVAGAVAAIGQDAHELAAYIVEPEAGVARPSQVIPHAGHRAERIRCDSQGAVQPGRELSLHAGGGALECEVLGRVADNGVTGMPAAPAPDAGYAVCHVIARDERTGVVAPAPEQARETGPAIGHGIVDEAEAVFLGPV